MKNREFRMVLALVVVAGLMMGLIAFRISTGGVTADPGNITPANNAPHPSTADEAVAATPDTIPQSTDSDSRGGEPAVPTKEPPEMAGPASGDPAGTAATPPSQPGAPTASPEESSVQ